MLSFLTNSDNNIFLSYFIFIMPEEMLMFCHSKNYRMCLFEHYTAQLAHPEIHIVNINTSVILSNPLNFKPTEIKIINNFYES